MSVFPPDQVREWAETMERVDYYRVLGLPRAPDALPYGEDVLRQAFLKSASAFHPDRYKEADAATRGHAETIFRRVNEAYRVLRHPLLRPRYHALMASGVMRLTPEELARGSNDRISAVPGARVSPTPVPASMPGARPSPSPPPSGRLPGVRAPSVTPPLGSNVAGSPGAAGGAASSVTNSRMRVSVESMIELPASLAFAQEADRALSRGENQHAKLQLQLILAREPGNRRILQMLQSFSTPPPKR